MEAAALRDVNDAPPGLTPIPDLNAPALLSGLPNLTVSADLVDSHVDSTRVDGGRLEADFKATSALLVAQPRSLY